MRFYLQDMKWLWSRFFDKINGREQQLTQTILKQIDEYNIDKQIPDENFEEFRRQIEYVADNKVNPKHIKEQPPHIPLTAIKPAVNAMQTIDDVIK